MKLQKDILLSFLIIDKRKFFLILKRVLEREKTKKLINS